MPGRKHSLPLPLYCTSWETYEPAPSFDALLSPEKWEENAAQCSVDWEQTFHSEFVRSRALMYSISNVSIFFSLWFPLEH